jgi:hypothetical protein
MLASASAAALTTLAVTVAVPAIADEDPDSQGPDEIAACLRDHGLAGAPDGPGLKDWVLHRLESGDATAKRALNICAPPDEHIAKPDPDHSEREVRACLSEHGVQAPAGDGRVLKQWILEHGDDAANRDAMKACHMAFPGKPGIGGGECGEKEGVMTVRPAEGGKRKPATEESDAAPLPAVGDGF